MRQPIASLFSKLCDQFVTSRPVLERFPRSNTLAGSGNRTHASTLGRSQATITSYPRQATLPVRAAPYRPLQPAPGRYRRTAQARRLTERASTMAMVMSEIKASSPISVLAQRLSGKTSAGLNAKAVCQREIEVVRETATSRADRCIWPPGYSCTSAPSAERGSRRCEFRSPSSRERVHRVRLHPAPNTIAQRPKRS